MDGEAIRRWHVHGTNSTSLSIKLPMKTTLPSHRMNQLKPFPDTTGKEEFVTELLR
jgi:hypothetical protein